MLLFSSVQGVYLKFGSTMEVTPIFLVTLKALYQNVWIIFLPFISFFVGAFVGIPAIIVFDINIKLCGCMQHAFTIIDPGSIAFVKVPTAAR
jgi:hypothetical protein